MQDRKKIVFLTRALNDTTGREMWKGVDSYCMQNNLTLITFSGAQLGRDKGEIIYYTIDPKQYIGGLTWASSDAEKEIIDYYSRFKETPLICLSLQVPGHTAIVADNKPGMIDEINHLIEVHNKKKIAFVRGPENHVYAKARYEGYLESLKNHDITIDETLISPPGGWGLDAGEKAVDLFIKERKLIPGKDFDALVCVGDNVGIGALERLTELGYSIPRDVAIAAFNGTYDAKCCNPPLTTVEMPYVSQGITGIETLMKILNGETVPRVINYPAVFLPAQSCGCSSKSVKLSAEGKFIFSNNGKKSKFSRNKDEVESSLSELKKWKTLLNEKIYDFILSDQYNKSLDHTMIREEVESLIDCFFTALQNGNSEIFIEKARFLINGGIHFNNEIAMWQDVISILRNNSLTYLHKIHRLIEAESLFQQVRVMINEVDARIKKLSSILSSRKETILRDIGAQLITTYENAELMNILAKSVGKLDIQSVYVVLYENCSFTKQNKLAPTQGRLILAVSHGKRIPLDDSGFLFDISAVVPEEYLPQRHCSLVVESLHFQDSYLGYIVFEAGPKDGAIYLALKNQLSSALYSAYLVNERSRVKDVLQETFNNMSNKVEVVSDHSENISSNVDTIAHSMEIVARNIKDISDNIQKVVDIVEESQKIVQDSSNSISELITSTQTINDVIGIINEVAERTNVLALNAAIEASHAGEAGKGFSVVAKEVKQLAAQTVASTNQIHEIVKLNKNNTDNASETIRKTKESIKIIADLSSKIIKNIKEQVASTDNVSNLLAAANKGTTEINEAIHEIASLKDKISL
ncbi:MAG: hypothetical protein E7062_04265 [Spirochaetaceae bacterium]|nr:hypothetical protein [Spirochaetaceae bacterium]